MADPFYYPIFDIEDPVELDRLLSAAGPGTLITTGPEGLALTHIPFVFEPATRLLQGHVSLRNPHSGSAARDALVLFGGDGRTAAGGGDASRRGWRRGRRPYLR